MKVEKERADVLLVQQGFFETREKAKRAIMAGVVYVNEVRIDKPGEKIPREGMLAVKGNTCPYVGRGGYKLEKALKYFAIDLTDRIMVDIGSSTGGFTDCGLMNGAGLSYAIDVGTNQLAWKLRNDSRVVVMAKTNFRYVTPEHFTSGLPNFASIDVSFISLRLILPVVAQIMAKNSEIVCLVKPQFEAGKEQVGKKGIVRDEKVHIEVLKDILSFASGLGFIPCGLTFSPITGGDGNIEFLLDLKWRPADIPMSTALDPVAVVKEAKETLRKAD